MTNFKFVALARQPGMDSFVIMSDLVPLPADGYGVSIQAREGGVVTRLAFYEEEGGEPVFAPLSESMGVNAGETCWFPSLQFGPVVGAPGSDQP